VSFRGLIYCSSINYYPTGYETSRRVTKANRAWDVSWKKDALLTRRSRAMGRREKGYKSEILRLQAGTDERDRASSLAGNRRAIKYGNGKSGLGSPRRCRSVIDGWSIDDVQPLHDSSLRRSRRL